MKRVLVVGCLLLAACGGGGEVAAGADTTTPTTPSPSVGVCVPNGSLPIDPAVDIANGMDRIPASFLSGTLHSCEQTSTPTTAVLDAGYPTDEDPTLSTTDLDGLTIDADDLAGVSLRIRWLDERGFDAESSWSAVVESSPGRWDVPTLPDPGRYLLEMSFTWADSDLSYTAKVNIPDPLG